MIDDNLLQLLGGAAHLAREQRRFDDARYLLERLAILFPDRAFPYMGLGRSECDRGAYRDAAVLFRRALDKVPGYAGALAMLGISQIKGCDYKTGVRALERVLSSREPLAIELLKHI